MVKKQKKVDPLSDCVTRSMQQYFADMNGQKPTKLYQFFMGEVEKPFLETVMQQVEGNQSQAAEILGINRNTLRKKLKQYNLC
ncbi:MAG: DNA-binding transcriptional regulator Fis [Pseudomonadota bacterium]